MLYTRSSFIKWLTEHKDCETHPIPDSRSLIIYNGSVSAKIWLDKMDRIDYEEIWLVCNKLYIDGLPGEANLKRVE